MSKLRLPILFFFLGSVGLLSSALAGTWKNEAQADIGFESRFFPGATGGARSQESWLNAGFEFNTKHRNVRRWAFSAEVSGQYLFGDEGTEWNKSGSPHYFEPQELAFEYRNRRQRLRIGVSSVRWGILDLYDPLDQVNSRRFESPIASDNRGDPMLLWQHSKPLSNSTINVETFYLPRKKNSILPSKKSPWLPRELYAPNLSDVEFRLPRDLIYEYTSNEELDSSLSHAFGTRIVFRGESNEIAFQYDEGASAFPNVRPELTGTVVAVSPQTGRTTIQADPLIKLTEIYYRERRYGGSLTRTFQTSLLRLQLARTERMFAGRKLARDRTDLTIGLEQSVLSSTLLAQIYLNALKLDTRSNAESGNDLASFSSLFDQAIAAGWRYPFSDSSAILVGGLYSPGSQSDGWTALLMTKASLALAENLMMEFNLNLIESGARGPISQFAKTDNVQLNLTAVF